MPHSRFLPLPGFIRRFLSWLKSLFGQTSWPIGILPSIYGEVCFFLFSLWVGGFLQGLMWANWADGSSFAEFHDNLTRLPFLQTVADMRSWWILRAIGGVIILFANMLFVVNIFNTIVLKPVPQTEPSEEARANA